MLKPSRALEDERIDSLAAIYYKTASSCRFIVCVSHG